MGWGGRERVVFYSDRKKTFLSHRLIMRYQPPDCYKEDLRLVLDQARAQAARMNLLIHNRLCCL